MSLGSDQCVHLHKGCLSRFWVTRDDQLLFNIAVAGGATRGWAACLSFRVISRRGSALAG